MKELKHSESFYIRKLLKETAVEEIMASPAVSIKVDAPFGDTVRLFKENRIRHLPVVNNNNEVVGLITQRDLYKVHSPRKLEDGSWYFDADSLNDFILAKVMIDNPFTLHPEDKIAEAIIAMAQHKYGCIPIVDHKNVLYGILTQYDILKIAMEIVGE